MKFQPNLFYHIFNRGNNRQNIFPTIENYFFFLNKVKKELEDKCQIIAYCLMPNHYHLLLHLRHGDHEFLPSGRMQVLQRKIGTLQSSYTRAVNIQYNRSGSLFQPKFRLTEFGPFEAETCFHYIHQNPVKAGLCSAFEEWEFSSYREYCSLPGRRMCDREVAYEMLNVSSDAEKFVEQAHLAVVNEKVLWKLSRRPTTAPAPRDGSSSDD